MTNPIYPPTPLTRRRAELLAEEHRGDGIDYVEVDPGDHRNLTVGLLRPLPAGIAPLPTDSVVIKGGERIRGIRTVSLSVGQDAQTIRVQVDRGGDYSIYELELTASGLDLDPVLRRISFSFMAGCASDQDCRPPAEPVDLAGEEPLLDTLAKDYVSFRQALLDFSAQRHPAMSDQHPADLSITLLELLAFHADQLSYAQDAAFAEGYLDTARRRISVRRHAKLVDYRLHQGRNAFAAVHIQVRSAMPVPVGSPVLTRIPGPLRGSGTAPSAGVDASLVTPDVLAVPPLSGSLVFETSYPLDADPRNNVLHVHHWGEDAFWLPAGATTAWLWAEDPTQPHAPGVASEPPLQVGDLLLIEQARSPVTGLAADADPDARWVVRLTEVRTGGTDPAYQAAYTRDAEGQVLLTERTADAEAALPLLAVRWAVAEAPDRPVCVRTVRPDGDLMAEVSVARGNMVLADHGLTVGWDQSVVDPVPLPLRLRLPDAPLTHQMGRLGTLRRMLDGGPEDAVPALVVTARNTAGSHEVYTPVPDLFESGPNAMDLVVEVDDTGHGVVRFGDGTLGHAPLDAVAFHADYRVGNGTVGNVGAESLVHIVLPAADAKNVEAVRNPLPATGGAEPESIERARRLATDAYQGRQERAVTERDAVNAVLRLPSVRSAVAVLRWTGSWYTWLVAVLPTDPADLVEGAGTRQELSASLRAQVLRVMDQVRLAGQDADLRPPWFVPVDLELHVCAAPGQSRSVMRRAIRDALLARWLPGGRSGLLAPQTLTFGRSLLMSEVYATVAGVPGVDSVKALILQRYGRRDNGELAAGRLDVAPWEVLQLDDDPSLPGRGVLVLEIDGGTS